MTIPNNCERKDVENTENNGDTYKGFVITLCDCDDKLEIEGMILERENGKHEYVFADDIKSLKIIK